MFCTLANGRIAICKDYQRLQKIANDYIRNHLAAVRILKAAAANLKKGSVIRRIDKYICTR